MGQLSEGSYVKFKDDTGLASQDRTSPGRILLTDTSRWASSARMAVSLSEVGFEVFAVGPHRGPLAKTRAVRQTFPYSGIRILKSLEHAIGETRPSLVIPCDDRAAGHLHKLHRFALDSGPARRELATLIEHSLGLPQSYPVVSSRYDLLEIAREEGLRVPATYVLAGMGEVEALRERLDFPWVLKADGTWGGRGVKVVCNSKEAKQSFSQMTDSFGAARALKRLVVNRDPFYIRPWLNHFRPSVVAQRYIQGQPANCAVVCREGKVLAGFGVEVVSAEGATGPAGLVRVVEGSEMMHCAKRLASRLSLSGFFGLDFMVEEGGGRSYLIEMNPRCTPLCHLRLGEGRDMVGALYEQLAGRQAEHRSAVTENSLIAYFPQAWTSESASFKSSFQDIPRNEPELVEELLRPWPERSLLFRMAKYLGKDGPKDDGMPARKPAHRVRP
jgi:ATP-grasp domain